MRTTRSALVAVTATAALVLSACGGGGDTDSAAESGGSGDGSFPITVEHAFGETVIEQKPERVAAVAWGNHEAALALGVVPVIMEQATYGDDDGNGVLPWVEDKVEEMGEELPDTYDFTDGIDFEAIANSEPDVILAGYSGLTQEDYDTLSEIAPVVAYPETAWGTPWREMIKINSSAIGLGAEGEELIAELEGEIEAKVAEHPALEGQSTMFLTHVDPSDLSEVNFYTTHDTRAMFFEDLGMQSPRSIQEASDETTEFSGTVSAEQADVFDDVDVIVTYGDESLIETLEGDELLSQMPAVENEAIVALPGDQPLGTAANPTPLSISYILDEYLDELDAAAQAAN